MFKDLMIQASFWSNLLYTIAYPVIHLYLMQYINAKIMSISSIVICLSTIIVNFIWNKYSNRLYKFFNYFLFLEGLSYFILTIVLILNFVSPIYYYIIDTILLSLITKNIVCGGNKLRSIIYRKEQREKYDNTSQIAVNAACLIGYGINVILDISINIALVISLLGIIIDNIFYSIIYIKENKK